MSGSGVGSGSHGRHIGGQENEKARRSCPRALRLHIADNGDLGVEDILDNFLHRDPEASRSGQLNEQEFGLLRLRLLDGIGNKF